MSEARRLDALAPDPSVEPDRPVVFAPDRTWSATELAEATTDAAAALADAGLVAGGLVAVMLPNGGEVVAALFGTWRAGGAYLPLNPRLTAVEVDRLVGGQAPAAVVAVAADVDRIPAGPAVVVVDRGVGTWTVARSADPGHDPASFPADVALVQLTSGTTGPPKAVPLHHGNVVDLMDQVLDKIGATPPAPGQPADGAMPNLVPVSLSLWAGLYNVLFAFRVGAPAVVMDRFDPATFAELVARHQIRSTVLPPAAMSMLADDATITSLAPLRYVRSITAPLSPAEARRFADRFGTSVLNSYGQTELGGEIVGWNAADSRAHGREKLGSVGRPHDGVRLKVIAADGVEADADDVGEIVVRTTAMDRGDSAALALTERLTTDGWFRTGDLGRIDADGFVWIEGRVSDLIIRGGNKVFPGEVEEVIRSAPGVREVAVVGAPDVRLGEVPVAFVATVAGAPLDTDALEAHCRERLVPYKVPVRFERVDALPRNEVGKVLGRELVDRLGRAGEAADGPDSPVPDQEDRS
ncbi:MAG: long-chain fatty acid--CoA ligase [Acidimicrobiales bacterium]